MKKYSAEVGRKIRTRYAEIVAEITQKRASFDDMSAFDKAEWFPKIAIEGGVTAGLNNSKKAYFSKQASTCSQRIFQQYFGLDAAETGAKRHMTLCILDRAITRFDDITRDFNAVRGSGGGLKNIHINTAPKLKLFL